MRSFIAISFFAVNVLLFALNTPSYAQTPAVSLPLVEYPATRFDMCRQMFRKPKQFMIPVENPQSDAKILLGKTLFFDPRLSGTNSMACSTCHNPALAWSDGLPTAIGNGGQKLKRRTPSLLNLAFSGSLQWDNEFRTLEEQALAPIRKKTEMNQDPALLPAKLTAAKAYAPLFEAAFPGEGVSQLTIARALAAFQRTLMSGLSPFDDFLAGDDNAMSIDAKVGMVLFHEKAHCSACHFGYRLTDGQAYDIGHKTEDRGRGVVTKDPQQDFKFRNPSLTDVGRHPPYRHDGSLSDLKAVVEFYNRGGDVKRPTLSSDIRPLHLTPHEVAQIVAFINALSSPLAPFMPPTLPE
ncbi:MAG: c-type cytochrome [Chitinophagaceae bacterium]|nr:c-type cytochrome [Oligoflexus sp.]